MDGTSGVSLPAARCAAEVSDFERENAIVRNPVIKDTLASVSPSKMALAINSIAVV